MSNVNLVLILLAGGIATVMGRDLNLGSLIVGAMTMGIAVDDSIHMVSSNFARRPRCIRSSRKLAF